jgi:hypothetical protein
VNLSLRFARALALVSGLGGCAAASPAPTPETPPSTAHAGGEASAEHCATCSCDSASVNPMYCDANGHSGCCRHAVIPTVRAGPLAPPDLPA